MGRKIKKREIIGILEQLINKNGMHIHLHELKCNIAHLHLNEDYEEIKFFYKKTASKNGLIFEGNLKKKKSVKMRGLTD